MNLFNWSRFIRILANDLILLKARRVGMATLALVGLGLLFYLTNARAYAQSDTPMSLALFPVLLLGGGLIFTSIIYSDMHHSLERFHYLTLPCSNLERFLSRYLITAPFYYLYAIVVYVLFEQLAKVLCIFLLEATFVPFDPFSQEIRSFSLGFFAAHALFYTGAIYFRSYALIKTVASLFGLLALAILIMAVAIRIVYWDQFISLWEIEPGTGIDIHPPFGDQWTRLHTSVLTATLLWVLFLGYLGLRDHEVQDGL